MSDNKRVNVLVYAGAGATLDSVRHATWSLRRLLGPNYAVLTVTSDQILKEPWTATCALLVMPGGADLAYCRLLNGAGNRKIKQYIQLGGKYLGFCAGGYYGSSRCEFEVGKPGMEVVGDRELALFPGICRGLAFPGFVYHSEAGARAVTIEPSTTALNNELGIIPKALKIYYNGGGGFADTEEFASKGVEVLASYSDSLSVDLGSTKAAIVYCKVGEGGAILTGPHPEFSGSNLDPKESSNPDYPQIVEALKADDTARMHFMKACLDKLGLQVSNEIQEVPSLSVLHLSAAQPSEVSELVQHLHEHEVVEKGGDDGNEEWIHGENDRFRLESIGGRWDMKSIAKAVSDTVDMAISSLGSNSSPQKEHADAKTPPNRSPADCEVPMLRLFAHESALPDLKQTPHFNHHAFYHALQRYRQRAPSERPPHTFGSTLLYGEVVSSTSTLLEKNPSLLAQLPDGFTATATTQVAGRGRGTNVWVSPPGSLMFSTVLRHPISLTVAPVVFVQYLAAMATVQGIRQYDARHSGYERLDIRLKWPNDVYARDPSAATHHPSRPQPANTYVKIGGILVNSSYSGGSGGGAFSLVVGIGVNVANAALTTSLARLAEAARVPPFELEPLLASILVQFENLYTRFCRTGFDAWFQERYYSQWLHTGQIVKVETERDARARIVGISSDFGLLMAEEISEGGRPTGRRFQLQSDSNSFDFFRGLVKRKM